MIPHLLTLGISLALTPKGPADIAEAIRTAYVANRDAPKFGTIRFRLSNGEAADFEAACRGELKDPAVAEGFYAFDGPRGHFECVFPIEVMASRRKKFEDGGWLTQLSSSMRAVTDGQLTLRDLVYVTDDGKRETHTAQIEPGVAEYTRSVDTPFAFAPGIPEPRSPASLDRMIELSRPGGTWRLASVEEAVRLGEVETVLLTFDQDQGDSSARVQYWVDLERGALPRQIRRTDRSGPAEATVLTRLDDIRMVDVKCWLPFRMTDYLSNNKYTRQYIVSDTDFNERPPRSTFRLKFPYAIPMVNAATMTRYAPREVWDLSDLPRLGSGEATKLKVQAPVPDPPSMPGERPAPGPWWPWLLMVFGGALVTAAWTLSRRRRHA
jgi:hypothetical protein